MREVGSLWCLKLAEIGKNLQGGMGSGKPSSPVSMIQAKDCILRIKHLLNRENEQALQACVLGAICIFL